MSVLYHICQLSVLYIDSTKDQCKTLLKKMIIHDKYNPYNPHRRNPKKQATGLFESLRMNLSVAINMFM